MSDKFGIYLFELGIQLFEIDLYVFEFAPKKVYIATVALTRAKSWTLSYNSGMDTPIVTKFSVRL